MSDTMHSRTETCNTCSRRGTMVCPWPRDPQDPCGWCDAWTSEDVDLFISHHAAVVERNECAALLSEEADEQDRAGNPFIARILRRMSDRISARCDTKEAR